ncbi:MAG: hypothetical protein L3J03_05525 [Desulfobacterales bacterium]|nr:hypothetical protein [Desulfobacterales bacterium]
MAIPESISFLILKRAPRAGPILSSIKVVLPVITAALFFTASGVVFQRVSHEFFTNPRETSRSATSWSLNEHTLSNCLNAGAMLLKLLESLSIFA